MRARRVLLVIRNAARSLVTESATRCALEELSCLQSVRKVQGPFHAPWAVNRTARYALRGLSADFGPGPQCCIHSGRTKEGDASDFLSSPTSPWTFEAVATIPNLLSIARGASGPMLAAAVLLDVRPELIVTGITAAALSDWLDGYLARRWNQISVAGTYLDPAGDKIFVACISASLAAKGFIPTWLAASFITRDLALVGGVSYKRARELRWRLLTWGQFFGVGDGNLVNKSLPPLEPKTIGKICTALQFALFTGAMLHHTHGWPAEEELTVMQYATAVATALSATAYYSDSSNVVQCLKASSMKLKSKRRRQESEC